MNLLTRSAFRTFSYVEGASFVLLLFVAMPLKYFAGFPVAVSIMGALHGAIFVLYLVYAALMIKPLSWRFGTVVWAMAAGVLPFGVFFFHRNPSASSNG